MLGMRRDGRLQGVQAAGWLTLLGECNAGTAHQLSGMRVLRVKSPLYVRTCHWVLGAPGMGRACEEDALSISWEWQRRMQLRAAAFPPSSCREVLGLDVCCWRWGRGGSSGRGLSCS